MYCTRTTKTLLGLMLAGCMGTAAAVTTHTGPTNLGNLNTHGPAVVNNTIFGTSVAINDIYTFDIAPATQVVAASFNIALSNFLDISSFKIELRDSAHNLLASDSTFNTSGGLDLSASLAAGLGYKFVVLGTTSGVYGGAYAGALTPVPEADTYAMMLAGLGLVGFMVTRRKQV